MRVIKSDWRYLPGYGILIDIIGLLSGIDFGKKRPNGLLDKWLKSVSSSSDTPIPIDNKARLQKFALARDLALWLSEDLLPFSLVEGSGFHRFCLRRKVVKGESEIPVRTTVSRGALDDVYDSLKSLVVKKLPKDTSFHVSTDLWTDRYKQSPFITVVIHYVDESDKLMCVSLKTDRFPGPHTGAAILQEIIDTVRDFELREDMIFAAVSDAASNMRSGLKKFLHVRCVDHRIHRSLTADFYKSCPGKEVLALRSKLMRIYKRLIYKKDLIQRLAKQKSQQQYLNELIQAEEIEVVRGSEFSLVSPNRVPMISKARTSVSLSFEIPFLPFQREDTDNRFVDHDETEDMMDGFDPKGLKADVPTRWSSVCRLFESAASSHAVLNEVLIHTESYELILESSEVDKIRTIAKAYRVSYIVLPVSPQHWPGAYVNSN